MSALPATEEEAAAAQKDEQEASIERTISLNERRLDAVFEVLKACGASRVLDLGVAKASCCAASWPITSSRRSSAWTCPAGYSTWRNHA